MRDLKGFSVEPLQCKKPLQKPKVSRIIAVSCDFTRSAGVAVSCDMTVAESDDLRRLSSKTHDSHTIFRNFQYFHKFFLCICYTVPFLYRARDCSWNCGCFALRPWKYLYKKYEYFLHFCSFRVILVFSAKEAAFLLNGTWSEKCYVFINWAENQNFFSSSIMRLSVRLS